MQYESAQQVVSARQKLLFTLTVADLRIKICHGLHLHFFVIKNVSLDFMLQFLNIILIRIVSTI